MRALVLEGGGTKGSYEVGAYEALLECGYKFDCVIGASIGALNGAMIVSHRFKELKKFWRDVNVGEILHLSDETVAAINENRLSFNFIKDIFNIIKNNGVDLDRLRAILDVMVDEKRVRKSKINFGLVTVKRKNMEPIEIFIKDIPENKLNEYLNASCYLPGFKKMKIIDNEYYYDGGFHDVCPVNMALKNGYDEIIAVRVKGLGVFKRVESDTAKITYLEPSRNIGSILSINKRIIMDNMKMGYYDTIRYLKGYDGYYYVFKNRSNFFYKFISRKINERELRRIKTFFHVNDLKSAIIKSVEYVLEKEHHDYYHIRDIKRSIKYIKKHYNYTDHFIYEFVGHLKFIFH